MSTNKDKQHTDIEALKNLGRKIKSGFFAFIRLVIKPSPRRRVWFSFVLIIFLVVFVSIIDWPKGPDVKIGEYFREVKVHLGLDLQGGTHLVYKMDLSSVSSERRQDAISGVRDVIERRVNAYGVSEPIVQSTHVGEDWRLIVELPGIRNIDQAVKMIGETPYLEFREAKAYKASELPEEALAQILPGQEITPDTELTAFVPTTLTGKEFEHATVKFDPNTGEPVISLEFNKEGEELFTELTKKNVGRQIAIYLDGQMISAPRVNEPIYSGEAVITGKFTTEEAKELATRLNSGALPVPVSLISQKNIGATLGEKSLEQGIIAGLIGPLFVAFFMIFYYRLPGGLAVVALVIYAMIALAIFKLASVTLTLAGIAGFILSVGMAVDANVLIFERIKEELRGRSRKGLSGASEEGFKRAWSSIRDSNISTLLICLILAYFGTSIIRGFAITLGIGVLASMFTAVVVTRNFLRLLVVNKVIHKKLFGIVIEKKKIEIS